MNFIPVEKMRRNIYDEEDDEQYDEEYKEKEA